MLIRQLKRHHRDLHSFPTRRSSDLLGPRLQRGHAPAHRGVQHHAQRRRSEEHTSELQSHSDLVCRLLLEKKNPCTSTTTAATQQTSGTNSESTLACLC